MDLKVIYKNARCAVLEIEDGGTYETSRMYRLYLNGKFIRETGNAVTSIYDLKPDTSYQVECRSGEGFVLKSSFTTDSEFVTLDVRDFGAKGVQDFYCFVIVSTTFRVTQDYILSTCRCNHFCRNFTSISTRYFVSAVFSTYTNDRAVYQRSYRSQVNERSTDDYIAVWFVCCQCFVQFFCQCNTFLQVLVHFPVTCYNVFSHFV